MFAVGAAMPLLALSIAPMGKIIPMVVIASLGFLTLLGAIGAQAGGAHVGRATMRVTFWGALAMLLTAGIGTMFGTVVRLSIVAPKPQALTL
jgi:vacuolar iron transporter family protein